MSSSSSRRKDYERYQIEISPTQSKPSRIGRTPQPAFSAADLKRIRNDLQVTRTSRPPPPPCPFFSAQGFWKYRKTSRERSFAKIPTHHGLTNSLLSLIALPASLPSSSSLPFLLLLPLPPYTPTIISHHITHALPLELPTSLTPNLTIFPLRFPLPPTPISLPVLYLSAPPAADELWSASRNDSTIHSYQTLRLSVQRRSVTVREELVGV